MKNHFLILFFTFSLSAFSQKEANNWYFGFNAGITFNGKTASAITDGKLWSNEGGASMSDNEGKLLFYTDGITVWDRTHDTTPNGHDLKGNKSSTQSAIIVPHPNNKELFYIFTVDAVDYWGGHDYGMNFSLFDMSLNSGKGDIVNSQKNIKLASNTCEKLTAVRHANKKDFWVLTHIFGTDSIYAYLVTSSGVNLNPVKSKTGFKIRNSMVNYAAGYMKVSPDGTKIAYANNLIDSSGLGDFDAKSGKVSNVWPFMMKDSYGLEFSARSQYLYLASWLNNGTGSTPSYDIYQFNAKSKNIIEFLASKIKFETDKPIGSMQLGPDRKIYMIRGHDSIEYLDVIHAPDSIGNSCRIQKDYIYLNGKTVWIGLPNFITSYFQKTTFDIIGKCINNPTFFSISTGTNIDSVKWDFGESISGKDNISNKTTDVFHVYKNYGDYLIRLITFNKNQSDTLESKISFEKPKADFTVSDICENKNAFFINKSSKSSEEPNYKWKFGDGQTSTLESPQYLYKIGGISQTFNVTLVVKTKYGCSDSINKQVTINASPKSDFTYAASKNIWNFTPTQSGNTKYLWLFGDGDSAISGTTSHNYKDGLSNHKVCLKATNVAGCISETCKQIVTTGIFPNQTSGFKIYPNPNTGNFTIEIDNPEKDVSIEVYNSVGGLVKKVKMVEKVISINLDVSSGIYLVKVRNGELEYNQKVSITK